MAEISHDTLACTYAALILVDDGASIDAEKLNKIFKAAHVEVESFWPSMFARALAGQDVNALISKIGAAAPAAAAAPAGAAAPAAAEEKKADAKKKAPEPEPEEDMGFSLFD